MRISGLLTCCGQLSLVAPKVEKLIALQTKQLVTQPEFCDTPSHTSQEGFLLFAGSPKQHPASPLCSLKAQVRSLTDKQGTSVTDKHPIW